MLSKEETRRLTLESPNGQSSSSTSHVQATITQSEPEHQLIAETDDDEDSEVRLQKIRQLFASVAAGDGAYTQQALQGSVTAEELRLGCESVGLSLIDSAVRGLLERIYMGGKNGWDTAITIEEFQTLIDLLFVSLV